MPLLFNLSAIKNEREKYCFLAVLLLVFSIPYFLPETVAQLLQFDRELIAQGQGWRFITGHFVYFTFYHYAMNVIGLAFCSFFIYWYEPRIIFWLSFLLIPIGVSIGIYWFSLQSDIYRGFSAVFYGMIAMGVFIVARNSLWLAGVLALALYGKLYFEQQDNFDRLYMENYIDAAVATDAHLAGTVSGLIIYAVYRLILLFREKLTQ